MLETEQEVAAYIREIIKFGIPHEDFAEVINLCQDGTISRGMGYTALREIAAVRWAELGKMAGRLRDIGLL